MIALAGALGFALLRCWLAAGWDVTRFVRAAAPFAAAARTPRGLHVFPGNGYDGQFYYRLALDPADLHRTAFGITMDAPFRLQRIGYPVLAWLLSLGQHGWVPVALVAVNVAAIGALGVTGGLLARDGRRHALFGLLLAGYFGFFMSLGNDLTEPVAAACLLGGVLAYRRGRPAAAGLLFGYAALTRETALIVPLALAITRLPSVVRGCRGRGREGRGREGRGREGRRPAATDLAWSLPVAIYAAWQAVLRAATGQVILLSAAASNASHGLPFGAFGRALRLNLGLLWPPTGAAYIWFLELATLIAFLAAAIAALRAAAGPVYERVAFAVFTLALGVLSGSIWAGHADLRSLDESYLFAVLILLGSRRRPGALAWCAAVAAVLAAVHWALYLS
jgi:hypothetical protein